MVSQTFSGRIPLNAIESNCVISTWQSWDFRFWIFFLFHIYYSLYVRREARRDLDTEKDFKKDFLLFLGKSVAGRPLKLPWMLAVSSFMTLLVLPCFRCIF